MLSFDDSSVRQGRLRGDTHSEGLALSIGPDGNFVLFGSYGPVVDKEPLHLYIGCAQGDGTVINHVMTPLRVLVLAGFVVAVGDPLAPSLLQFGKWRRFNQDEDIQPVAIALEPSDGFSERLVRCVQFGTWQQE